MQPRYPGDGKDNAAQLGAGMLVSGDWPDMQSVGTTARAGSPQSSVWGQFFARAFGPRRGSPAGLINLPMPIQMHHRPEMGLVGSTLFAAIAPNPIVAVPGGYGGPMPLSELPVIPVSEPWTIDPADLGALGR